MFILFFALLGYAREFFFVHLNNVLFMLYYQREAEMPVPAVMRWAQDFSYERLYYSKYLFTLLCTLIYYLLSLWTLKKLALGRFFERVLSWTYLLFIVLSAFSMAYAWFVKERLNAEEYTLSRWLMGVLQSPIICLILLAAEPLYQSTQNHDPKREDHL
ncbi:MAG TPA: hypothetical protein PLQ93_13300 [Bacteroidia bacterium]|nr:hypothetical protein [Bacteroidia bacterium]